MRKTALLQRVPKIFVISALTIIFFACSDELKIQEKKDKTTVSFSVTDSLTRTVLPQVSLADAASYKLLGGRNGEAETVLVESFTGTGTSVSLDPGTWNFTLNAYNSSGGHILQGKVQDKQISLDYTNQVSFSLSVVESGTGSIEITFRFPETAEITKISASGDVGSEDFTGITNGTFVYSKNNFTAGDYLIDFKFYREGLLKAVVTELVVVRNNLTSSKIITLVGENLKPLPTYEITINSSITGTDEWELTQQSAQAAPNEDHLFTVTGTYTAYRWYLDGVSVGTSASYTFNKPAGVYQLAVVVTNSSGESRSGRCRVTVSQVVEPLLPETVTILSEDFEGTNSFTMVNGTQTNQWYTGTVVRYAGSKSAYISNNSGTSNAYTITSTSVVHMYRDVTFPSSASPYTLTFYWKAQGEGSSTRYDYLRVFLIETSVTPVAGSQPSGTTLGTYNLGGADTWNQASISIPVTNSGTTKRLVFTWVNDSSSGTQPPAAVDNILLTGDVVPPTGTLTLTYNANSGTGTVPAQIVNAGSSVTLPSGNGLTRSGYTFGGWNTSSAGTGTNYSAGSSYTPMGNSTLYARWLANYTVTFNVNSGTGTAPPAQTVTSGTGITLPGGSGLTRSGYIFGGWNTASNGTGTNYDAGTSYTPTASTTLYAKWLTTYTVTFNINGGTGTTPPAQTVLSGYRIALPSGNGFSRNGYTFGGWNAVPDGTGYNLNPSYSFYVSSDRTLYAKWDSDGTAVIFSEDFEGTNSFTMVNGSQTNKWYAGTATKYAGTKSAYISNDNGTSNAYTITSTSVVHMYRDVIFLSSAAPYTLTFYWKAQGESGYDDLKVFLIETSVTPAAGTSLSGTALGTYNSGGASTWNQATINIPAANSGTTKRLVFTWRNDNSAGTQPPAAVDNIVLIR